MPLLKKSSIFPQVNLVVHKMFDCVLVFLMEKRRMCEDSFLLFNLGSLFPSNNLFYILQWASDSALSWLSCPYTLLCVLFLQLSMATVPYLLMQDLEVTALLGPSHSISTQNPFTSTVLQIFLWSQPSNSEIHFRARLSRAAQSTSPGSFLP